MKQSGLLELLDHLKRLSANGDPLEELGRIVDLEGFCPVLEGVLAYSDRAKRGRPPYDPVAMFKMMIHLGIQRALGKRLLQCIQQTALVKCRTRGTAS